MPPPAFRSLKTECLIWEPGKKGRRYFLVNFSTQKSCSPQAQIPRKLLSQAY